VSASPTLLGWLLPVLLATLKALSVTTLTEKYPQIMDCVILALAVTLGVELVVILAV